MCTQTNVIFFYRAQNGNQHSSAQRRLCSAVSFLRGHLNLATSSELHIRPGTDGDRDRVGVEETAER